MTFDHYTLAKLIHPVTPEAFFDEYWEKKPLIVHRDDPDYYRDLLNFDKVDAALTSHDQSHGQVFMGNFNDPIKTEDYTYDTGLIDVAKLFSAFEGGSSIALNSLHDRVASLANLCRSMEQEWSMRFQTNIYFTPGNAQCFPPHYDSHCVFAMQCEGRKNWRLYDYPLELPFHTQGFDVDNDKCGDVTEEFVLNAGDFIYCPRGLGHDADTQGIDEPSLHITMGVLQKTWSDFLLESVAAVALEEKELRRGLPVGLARPGFDRAHAEQVFERMRELVWEKMSFERTLDWFAEDMVVTRHPILPGQLKQIMMLQGLETTNRRVGRRPNLLYQIDETDERVNLSIYGRVISMPAYAGESMRYALENDDFPISDLPGDLDDAGKIVLIKRLVREGVVMLAA